MPEKYNTRQMKSEERIKNSFMFPASGDTPSVTIDAVDSKEANEKYEKLLKDKSKE